MKSLFLVVLLAASSLAVQMSDKDEIAYMNNMIQNCTAELKIPQAEVDGMRKTPPVITPNGKCLLGCMFEKMGMLVHGQFSKANSDKVADLWFNDSPNELKKAKDMNVACDKMAKDKNWGANKCESGPALFACMKALDPALELIPKSG